MQHVETDRRTMMQNYPDFYPLAATAVLIAIGIGIGWMLFASDRLDGYGTNVWTEVLSIGVTVAVIDRLNQRRAAQQRKAELIQQLGSRSNDFALEAARLLKPMGILTDGTLKGADLEYANLCGADFEIANLSGVHLMHANLSGAKLRLANLSGATLLNTNLSSADLLGVILSDAVLIGANLSGANLGKVDLSGVFLLQDAIFDENTTLPDKSKWRPDTDMSRFTDPQHPDFWRSKVKVNLSAFRGDSD